MQHETIEGFHLSPQQKRIWRMQQEWPAFKAQAAVSIDGPLDVELLTAALEELTARHEILRTGFCSLPGMELPLQIIGDSAPVSLKQIDLSKAADPAAEIVEQFHEQLAQPFDYEQVGLTRFTLLRVSPERHVLLIALPALCADSFSLQLLTRQLVSAYESTDWPSEPLPYVEFSEWQNALLESDEPGDVLLPETSETTSTGIPVLPFEDEVTALDHKTKRSFVEFSFDAHIVRQIEQSATEAFLLTAWLCLLRRLSQQDRVSVYCGLDRRNFVEFQNAVGLFSTHVPISTEVEGTATFTELASRVQQQLDAIRANCEYNDAEDFRFVLGARRPIGFDLTRTDLVQSGATSFSTCMQYVCTDAFKLQLSFLLTQGVLKARLHYDPRSFSHENVELLVRRYVQLIRTILAAPASAPVHSLELIDTAERHLLLRSLGPTIPERSNPYLHELFEAQADKTPEATAVKENNSVTFAELNQYANRLARYLRRKGVGPETTVAIVLERSWEMIAAVFAVAKAGGAYVPLEAKHPPQRLASMLACANPRVLLTQSDLLAGLPDFNGEILCLDICRNLLAAESDQNLLLPLDADNLAYVIFTSGSTGEPKGVMIQHRAVANLAAALSTHLCDAAEARSTVTLNAPLSFDASLKQLIQLAYGHTLYVVPEEARADGSEMLYCLHEHNVNVLDCTPSHLKALLMAGITERCASNLRKVLVGGEALDTVTWQQLASVESIDFYNVYGPTECTDVTTLCRVRNDQAPGIGHALANVETLVLDERMQLTPIGAPGELYIGGEGLGRGYLGHPDLTAERFVPHPFANGKRLYRTGDLVRVRPDGFLEFLTRADQQVKLHGFRVEPGEIACVLKRNYAVADAFVAVRDHAGNGKRLVAYVVPAIAKVRLEDVGPVHKLPNGMLITHQNQNETRYLYEEIFEKQTYLRHGVSLWDGMCIFDVGANIGMFSLFASQRCRNARIYAFEPLLPIFKMLRANATLDSNSIKVFPIGLSKESQSATFTYYPRYSMMSGLSKYARPEDEIAVIRTFLKNEQLSGAPNRTALLEHADDLLRERFVAEMHEADLKPLSAVMADEEIERIDLLKIDVQRAELDVLDGISDDDWRKIEQIVMEVHDEPGQERRTAEITARLENHGFQVVVEQDPLLEGTDRFNVYAVRSVSRSLAPTVTASGNGAKPQADPLSHEALRQFLQDKLPEYMIPSVFVTLDALPLTVNGKIDVAALPASEEANAKRVRKFEPPHTAAEQILHDAWTAVLGLAEISIHDNFFDVGGDSIRCIQVQAIAQKRGLTFSIQQLFRSNTIAELAKNAELVDQTKTPARLTEPFALLSYADRLKVSDDIEDAYPLAMLQKGMVYHSEYNCDGASYHNVTSVCLRGEFDHDKLKESVRRLVARHEILRTSFNLGDYSEPLQLVYRQVDLPLEVEDLRNLNAADRERAVDRWMESERTRRFDLNRAPLVRFQVHQLTEDTFQFSWAEHHACLDGWSLSSMISELFESYAALLRNQAVQIKAPPSFSFRDFVALERDTLASPECSDFWAKKLSGVIRTALPRDPAAGRSNSARRVAVHRHAFASTECEKLKRVAAALGVPLKSVLLAAHLRVLSVVSGQAEVLTGLVSNGRQEEEGGDQVLGLFINTLPFRLALEGGAWSSLIKATFDNECELLPVRRFPYAELQRMVGGPRLFDTYFNYSNFHVMRNLDQLQEIAFIGSRHIAVDVDFTLGTDFELNPASGELELCLSFDVTKLSRESVNALADRYVQALAAIAGAPETNYETLPLLTARERDLLSRLEPEREPAAAADGIHQLFEAQVKRTPSAICLVCQDQELTYAELNARANQLAHYLQRTGLRPEDRVGLLLERSADLVVAILATLKAGAAYAPLDANSPVQRLRYFIEDSAPKLLLTKANLASLASEVCAANREVEVIALDERQPQIARESESTPVSAVGPANLAYVLYTSGSTGFPKGVAIEHRNAVSLVRWAQRAFSDAELESVVVSSPLTFDSSAFELWAPITCGGKALLVRDLFDVTSSASASQATLISAVPSLMKAFLEISALPPTVRTVVFAGEPLTTSLQQQIHACGIEKIWNLYGLTEDTTYSTGAAFTSPTSDAVTIGIPLDGRKFYLLDKWMQPVPIGTVGEIYVGGEGLARGYLNQPDVTACRFVPNARGDVSGERLYRTGDLARLSDGGRIEFVGRIDQQVKLNGCRIELSEVEHSLLKHPAVEACVAHVTTNSEGALRLVAYVVSRDDCVDPDQLRHYLGELLPHYMIPATFVLLDELPLLANGKVNRQALPPPQLAVTDRPFVAPRTTLQISIADVWSEALSIRPLSLHDDFFALGGHSLLALQVVFRLRQLLGIDIPVRTLADAPVLYHFAQQLEALQLCGAAEVFSRDGAVLAVNSTTMK